MGLEIVELYSGEKFKFFFRGRGYFRVGWKVYSSDLLQRNEWQAVVIKDGEIVDILYHDYFYAKGKVIYRDKECLFYFCDVDYNDAENPFEPEKMDLTDVDEDREIEIYIKKSIPFQCYCWRYTGVENEWKGMRICT